MIDKNKHIPEEIMRPRQEILQDERMMMDCGGYKGCPIQTQLLLDIRDLLSDIKSEFAKQKETAECDCNACTLCEYNANNRNDIEVKK